jgi:hypothetical protein
MSLSRKEFLELTGKAMIAIGAVDSGIFLTGCNTATGGNKLEYKIKQLNLYKFF